MKKTKIHRSIAGAGMVASPLAPPRLTVVETAANSPAVIELTDQNFAPYIDGHPFAVVHFWAPSNEPSRAFAPIFAAAAARHADALFVRVDAEQQRGLAAQFKVATLPMVLIFRSNIVVHAKPGALPPGALDEVVNAARKLDMDHVRRQVTGGSAGAPDAAASASTGGQAQTSSLSIENFLRPSLRGSDSALADIIPRLAAGGLVEIRNAFEPDFAERMHRCLDRQKAWRVHENYAERFSYHHHNIYHPEEFPEDLASCAKIFDSPGSKAWASRLSGRACLGPTSISASWYLPGDHSLPHSDNVTTGAHFIRQLAFVWHLSKDWRSEWGGALYWCPRSSYLAPSFNTLYLFNVGPESTHFVTTVSPYAQGKRLTINGWWTGPASTGDPLWKGPDLIEAGGSDILVY